MSGGAVYAIVMAMLVAAGVGWRMSRLVRRLPAGIVRRLSGGHERVQVRVHTTLFASGLWNPAKPFGFGNLLYGRGDATYTLRDGLVRLRWVPHRGDVQDYVGPVPHNLIDETAIERSRARSRVVVAVLIGYVAVVIIAAVVVGVAADSDAAAVITTIVAMVVLQSSAIAFRLLHTRRTRRTSTV